MNYYKNKWGKLYNCDCMTFMKDIPDKYFELAIVDPPYGIGENWRKNKNSNFYRHKNNFNNKIPEELYFKELFRISTNQIIWGGNYYIDYLPITNSWIFWDKIRNVEKTFMSEGELAWTSFKTPMRKIIIRWDGVKKGNESGINTIHPHQKPVALYRWLLQKYVKPCDKIFDSHAGSASSFIACMELGFNYTGCEIDNDYYNESIKRIKLHEAKIENKYYLPDDENLLFKDL